MTKEYKFLTQDRQDGIAKIAMNRPSSNELNPEFMQEITNLHQNFAKDDEVKAIILYSKIPKIFSAGLDPNHMLSQNLAGRKEIFLEFIKMVHAVYSFPKPHFSIIEGSAIVGGAILALCSDYRYMVEKSGRFAVAEVAVGLVVPEIIKKIIEQTVSPKYVRNTTMGAQAYKPAEALEAGIVDYVGAAENIHQHTEKMLKRLLRMPAASVNRMKFILREQLIADMPNATREALAEIEPFIKVDSIFDTTLRRSIDRKRES